MAYETECLRGFVTACLMAWPAIVRRALAQHDEHVIKLVDSCREHERVYGPGPWRAAASRAVAAG